jgi:DNA-binding NarL/FixJ family response regulator
LIRVLLIAPIPAMRAGLRALIGTSDIQIAGEATRLDSIEPTQIEADVLIYASASASSLDASTFRLRQAPDDASLSAGLLPDSFSSASLLILCDDPSSIAPILQSQGRAWGILPLEATREELLAAIHALAEGLIVGTVPLMKKLLNRVDEGAPFDELLSPLTDREVEVLNLLALGHPNKQIALALGISDHTVKFHISSIYNKLDATNRAEAIRRGVRSGLISL